MFGLLETASGGATENLGSHALDECSAGSRISDLGDLSTLDCRCWSTGHILAFEGHIRQWRSAQQLVLAGWGMHRLDASFHSITHMI